VPLFKPFDLHGLSLRNRAVMAPLTRNRATADHLPTPMMAEYYAQRATMGLIISEGTSPSADGLGYARIPGLFSEAQVSGWKVVTDAVHAKGGAIVVQFMHCGRASHVDNLPTGARIVGPTDVPLPESIFTDSAGLQPASTPHALTEAEIATVVAEFAHAAQCAMTAGFDGVELHAANGYLIEQFLNANVNTRTDGYGGSAEHRNRFALEIARATVAAIGADRVGIRVSPYGAFNSTGAFADVEPQYRALATSLGALGLSYLHLVDHSSMGAPPVPAAFKHALKKAFGGVFIASGGFNHGSAEACLENGDADLVAFGRPVLANPDFLERMEIDAPMNTPDMSTFYTAGEKGYTDYPVLDMELVAR
jgi:N-ethylmaleimide reductase